MDNDDPQFESNDPSAGETANGHILNSGESFGNFRVVKCLTKGLIANYYHMQHVRDLHDVTVGIFHSRTVEDSKFIKRLKALQKMVQAFDHEGIPKIVDCAFLSDRHCIFLEPVRGQPLSKYYSAKGKPGEKGLQSSEVTRIVAQLLGILGYAHSQGLDHRDLDTDLIYIKADGTLQVLGIGIKSTLGIALFESIVSASVSPLVASESVCRLSSFDVMSPEYKAGVAETRMVDIHAVGAVGYWLLTGQKARLSSFVDPSTFGEDISKDWDVFFRKALEREPDQRFPTCKAALLSIQEGTSVAGSESAGFVQRQVDRILVPKRIEAKGQFASRVYRLAILGLIGVLLVGGAAVLLEQIYTEPPAQVQERPSRAIAKEVQGSEQPDIIVSVSPSVAQLEFVDHRKRFAVSDGLIQLMVQPGEHELLFTAPHHYAKTVSVTIPGGEHELMGISVELTPGWADMKIVSEPNASISIVNESGVVIDLGNINREGLLYVEKGVFAGVYQVRVRKEGYESQVLDNQEIASETLTELTFDLVPLPSSLTVRSQPAGARILMDGIEVGVSPLSLDGLKASGERVIVAQLPGYRSLERRIEVKAGDSATIDFGELIPRSGNVEVVVSFVGLAPAGAAELMDGLTLEIDGAFFPYAEGVFTGIKEGLHTMRLTHPLYVSESRQIRVIDGQTVEVDSKLVPRPGVVEVVLPSELDASIRVDGRAAELVDGEVNVAASRPVEVVLSIRDHMTLKLDLMLQPNERYVWEVSPTVIPGPQQGQPWMVPYLGHEFVWVEPGTYTMGSPLPESGRLPNEGPQTSVRFTRGFWAGVYEVTQARYAELMGDNPAEFVGPNQPVESVSWEQAKQFCGLLTNFEKVAGRLPDGFVYRLPTEAEWEYVARAGSDAPFSFGEQADTTSGNFRGVYPKSREDGQRRATHYGTLPVGTYQPNDLGLYDVHGNVEEWTLDFYNARLPGEHLTDPMPRTRGTQIAVRGGSWESFATATRSAIRNDVRPDSLSNRVGFRVVLAPVK
jgi:formylglycine-generating enzyme required for sulfatase activity